MMNQRNKVRQGPPAPLSAASLIEGVVGNATISANQALDLDATIRKNLEKLGNNSTAIHWISPSEKITLNEKSKTLIVPTPQKFYYDWCLKNREIEGDIILCLPAGVQVDKVEFILVANPTGSTPPLSNPDPVGPPEEIQEVFDFLPGNSLPFVAGSENKFTHDKVWELLNQETTFPLIVLWGIDGTGKSTLANQVYRRATRLFKKRAERYKTPQTAMISANGFQDDFMTCFRSADKNKAIQELQKRLRVRFLVVTDLDAFCGRKNQGTADALAQAMTKVIENSGRILMTMSVDEGQNYEETLAKINPSLIKLLGTKGFADFEVKVASLETRLEILDKLSGPNGEKLSGDSQTILARQYPNVATMVVRARQLLHGAPIENIIQKEKEIPSPQKIIEAIEAWCQLPKGSLVGRSRIKRIVQSRHLAIYLVAELHPNLAATMIGKLFGNRDHTTVLYAKEQVAMNIDLQDSLEAARKLFM